MLALLHRRRECRERDKKGKDILGNSVHLLVFGRSFALSGANKGQGTKIVEERQALFRSVVFVVETHANRPSPSTPITSRRTHHAPRTTVPSRSAMLLQIDITSCMTIDTRASFYLCESMNFAKDTRVDRHCTV